MQALKARVENGRLKLDEPTDLPEGQLIELVPLDEVFLNGGDDLDEGGMKACLEPGAVGYVASFFHDADLSSVTRVEYFTHVETSGFALPKTMTLELSPLSVTNGQMVSGSLTNNGSAPLFTPGVFFFAIAPGGRPIAFDHVSDTVNGNQLDVGATWNFVLPKTTNADRYVLFAVPSAF